MLLTTKGVVLREKTVGEADKFIDVLSEDQGLIEFCVRGVKKISSRHTAATQVFAYSVFCGDQKGDTYFLRSAEPISIFYPLRTEVSRFALASYLSEVLRYAVTTNEPAREVLRLLLNTLHFLSEGKKSVPLLKSIFELRLLSDIGMMPEVVGCHQCGAYSAKAMYLIVEKGILFCSDCYQYRPDRVAEELDPSLLHALRYITLTDFDKLWSFQLSPAAESRLGRISEEYLLSHLGRGFQTLDFYQSMLRLP